MSWKKKGRIYDLNIIGINYYDSDNVFNNISYTAINLIL